MATPTRTNTGLLLSHDELGGMVLDHVNARDPSSATVVAEESRQPHAILRYRSTHAHNN